LEEGGVVTLCELFSIQDDDIEELTKLALAFRSSPETVKLIIKSELFKEVIGELVEVEGGNAVTLTASPSSLQVILMNFNFIFCG